jgi:hypothetical protein
MDVGILIGELMIPLYQANPHDNSVRKNVRGLAVMLVLLSLFHEFGLDLLSPGNLVGRIASIASISKERVRKDQWAILLASGEDILSSLRPGPCTGSERPFARSTAGRTMSDTVRESRAVSLPWRTLASTRSTVNDLGYRLQPQMRFRGNTTYRRCN